MHSNIPWKKLEHVALIDNSTSDKFLKKNLVEPDTWGAVVKNEAVTSFGEIRKIVPEKVGDKKRMVGTEGDLCLYVRNESNITYCNQPYCLMTYEHLTLRPGNLVYPEYLILLFKSGLLKENVEKLRSGNNIGKKAMKELLIPIAPLETQQRMVEKWQQAAEIENEMFAYEEKAEQALADLQANLGLSETYDGSNIMYLDSEYLVERMDPHFWLEKNTPTAMEGVSLAQLVSFTSGCRITSKMWGEQGIPVIGNSNLNFFHIVGPPLGYVREKVAMRRSISMISPGEVAICVLGKESFGKAVLADQEYFLSQSLARVICDTNMLYPPFLAAYLNTPYARSQMAQQASGVKHKYLSLEQFASLPIPLPSWNEQVILARDYVGCIEKIAELKSFYKPGEEMAQELVEEYL